MFEFLKRLFGKDPVSGGKTDKPDVSICPIGDAAPLSKLPLWVDALDTRTPPAIYESLFWFIEPTAEYVYYLAGDFQKTDRGYLAFASSKTDARVEVTFEEDTIAVHRIDDWRCQGMAEQTSQYGVELSHMSLGDMLDQLPANGHADGLVHVMPFNAKYQLVSLAGMARFEVFKPFSQESPRELRMIFQALHREDDQPERLLDIRVTCRDAHQNIGELCRMFDSLIQRFGDLKYEKLSGATRF